MWAPITSCLGLADSNPAVIEITTAIVPYKPHLNGCLEKVQKAHKLDALKAWSIRTDGGPEFNADFVSKLQKQCIAHEETAGFVPNRKAMRD